MLPLHSAESSPMPPKAAGAPAMPRYLSWRDGRPRWQPGPMLRAKGFQGRDLKDDAGGWLTLWKACEVADALNREADDNVEAARARPAARSLAALLDQIEALPKFRDAPPDEAANPRRKVKRLSRDGRAAYLMHFRIARAWAGERLAFGITPADVDTMYDCMVEERGHFMANRWASAISMAFQYGVDKLQWGTHNPVKALEKVSEDGRLVMWNAEENLTFIQCADWLGWQDIGDAHICGLMTAQSRIDILAMPRLDLDAEVFKFPRHKTSRIAWVPNTRLLTTRLGAARQRIAEKFPGVTYRHEIINLETGAPYNLEGSRFSEKHRAVRAVASGLQQVIDQAFPIGAVIDYAAAPFTPVPAIWDKRFADLRDTALTLLLDATKGDTAKVANITAHSLRTVQRMADKHYFVRHQGMSRDAGGQLEQLMQRIGYAG